MNLKGRQGSWERQAGNSRAGGSQAGGGRSLGVLAWQYDVVAWSPARFNLQPVIWNAVRSRGGVKGCAMMISPRLWTWPLGWPYKMELQQPYQQGPVLKGRGSDCPKRSWFATSTSDLGPSP